MLSLSELAFESKQQVVPRKPLHQSLDELFAQVVSGCWQRVSDGLRHTLRYASICLASHLTFLGVASAHFMCFSSVELLVQPWMEPLMSLFTLPLE